MVGFFTAALRASVPPLLCALVVLSFAPGLPGPADRYGVVESAGGEGGPCPRGRPRAPIILGGPPPESATCKRLRLRLERIQARLRAGYREPAGAKLRGQRRAVTDQWLSTCFP